MQTFILSNFQEKNIVECLYLLCMHSFALNLKWSDMFITAFSAPLILGVSTFYMWVTKGPVITSFMSKLNEGDYQSAIQLCFLSFPLSLKLNLAP